MHLCLDARMLHASGIGTYLQNLIPALAENFSLTLIGDVQALKGYQTQVVPTSLPVYSVAELYTLPRLVPPCDVFWSPHYNVPVLPIKAKKRLVTIHDVFHLALFRTLTLKQKLYAQLMFKAATKLSDQIITVSAFSKSEIIKYTHVLPDKVKVIHNGVDHQCFRIIQDEGWLQAVKQKYQLPDKFILFVGNVKPHKNLMSLVKAFDKIKEEIPDVSLVIVGKKEGFITGESDLFQLINQHESLANSIIFTGFVATEDLPVVYNLANLFVFPSLYEGFGLPPLEAMACGCPVLVSDQASMPEICGTHIDYVDPLDIRSLSMKIKEMVNLDKEQREALTKTGLDKTADYTWEKSITRHIELISKLCADSTFSWP